MARTKTKLDAAQTVQLRKVASAHRTFKDALETLELEIRRQAEDRLRELETALALEVRRADIMRIPKTRIANDAFNMVGTHRVLELLAKTERIVDGEAVTFTWQDHKAEVVKVSFPGFPTTAIDATDYPAVLEGVVVRDAKARNGWRVLEDPGTVTTSTGTLPGFLTWEIESVPFAVAGSLSSLLSEWAETHS